VSFAADSAPSVLSTGYTLELDGNTHAEQNALAKLAQSHHISLSPNGSLPDAADVAPPERALNPILTSQKNVYLYTTLEPCGLRLSGATPCVQRIIATRQGDSTGGIRKVIFGAREPGTFVQDSQSLKMLDAASVEWEYVRGLENDILKVAKEGHNPHQGASAPTSGRMAKPTEAEEQQPRNPKKRMMEVDVPR
jgi:pyrimidine deaminase RibD-like protein